MLARRVRHFQYFYPARTDGTNVVFGAYLSDDARGVYEFGVSGLREVARMWSTQVEGQDGGLYGLVEIDLRSASTSNGKVLFTGFASSYGAAVFAEEADGRIVSLVGPGTAVPGGVENFRQFGALSGHGTDVGFWGLWFDQQGARRSGLFLLREDRVVKLLEDGDILDGFPVVAYISSRLGHWSSGENFAVLALFDRADGTPGQRVYVGTVRPEAGRISHLPEDCRTASDLDGDGIGDPCDPDTDGDGIQDAVDGVLSGGFIDQSRQFSNRFSDQGQRGVTFGTVVTNSGLDLTIRDAGDPATGLRVEGENGSGTARLRYCQDPVTETTVRLGHSFTITCGSAKISAFADPVDMEVGDKTITVPNLVTAKVDEVAPDQLEVKNDITSFDDVEVTVDDVKVSVPSSSGATLTESTEGQLTIAPTADSEQPVTAEINGQIIPIEPGAPPTRPVNIDIKPGSDDNSINLGSKGSIPVAILSSPTFDSATVDAYTAALSCAPVKLKGRGTAQTSMEDVNGDGLLDQIVHISTESLALSEGDTRAEFEAQLYDGTAIRGVDTIRVVP